MADDDNFDIDIYGDDAPADVQQTQEPVQASNDAVVDMQTDSHHDDSTHANGHSSAGAGTDQPIQEANNSSAANGGPQQSTQTQQISSTGGSASSQAQIPKQAPRQQGMKRKQGDDDDRPADPGASAALMINDLQWWVNEEDVRGWANQSGCEDELVDVTFSEHKVNGKSKGQVYVKMQSPQAATALKRQLESFYADVPHGKKPSAVFSPAHINPFKTLPKDQPKHEKNRNDRGSGSFGGDRGGGNFGGNRFNNNRGNFNNRGNMHNNTMGFHQNQNRNFSGPAGGNMGGGMSGGFGGPGGMNNFGGGGMGGPMNNFGGGFNNRGNMGGGMRGGMNNRGRGGNMGMNMGGGMPMGGNMMGGMGMGGMNMPMGGGMGMGMGMGGMGGPGGFGGNQPQFNPAMFNASQQGDGNWNPHPAKRPRPE